MGSGLDWFGGCGFGSGFIFMELLQSAFCLLLESLPPGQSGLVVGVVFGVSGGLWPRGGGGRAGSGGGGCGVGGGGGRGRGDGGFLVPPGPGKIKGVWDKREQM